MASKHLVADPCGASASASASAWTFGVLAFKPISVDVDVVDMVFVCFCRTICRVYQYLLFLKFDCGDFGRFIFS